jgi:hypothetical protein
MSGDRSVHAGRDIVGSAIATGDGSTATVRFTQVALPPPESVDIAKEIAAIRAALGALQGEHASRIGNALAEAEEEAARPAPDRDEIGKALGRALDYAQKSAGFAEQVAKLAPHVTNAAAWLGASWHRLLAVVGLAA